MLLSHALIQTNQLLCAKVFTEYVSINLNGIQISFYDIHILRAVD